jgi:hypothetical protein
MVKKTTEEKIAALKQQLADKKARLDRLQAKQSAAERRADARRKIIIGGAVLAHAEHDAAFASTLKAALKKAVTRDKDKEAISDLLK